MSRLTSRSGGCVTAIPYATISRIFCRIAQFRGRGPALTPSAPWWRIRRCKPLRTECRIDYSPTSRWPHQSRARRALSVSPSRRPRRVAELAPRPYGAILEADAPRSGQCAACAWRASSEHGQVDAAKTKWIEALDIRVLLTSFSNAVHGSYVFVFTMVVARSLHALSAARSTGGSTKTAASPRRR